MAPPQGPAATASRVLSRYLVASPPFRRAGGPLQRVVLPTRAPRPLVVGEGLWQALVAGDVSAIDDDLVHRLVGARVLVDEGVDELGEVVDENVAAIGATSTLSQVVQPTAACQLGCGYCGQEHSATRLSQSGQDALVARIDRRLASGRYDALSISWFGAEPLLGLDVMRTLSPRLLEQTARRELGFHAKIVTNGVRLTPEVAAELLALHHVTEAEVTLDGPAAVHDTRRHTKGGRPSFDRIVGNLVAVAARPDLAALRLVVRCNVDRDNADHVGELIDLLAERGLAERIDLYVSPVYAWGNDASSGLTLEDFGVREVEWFAHMHQRGFRVGLLPTRRPIVCLAVQDHGELTDAFGGIFNCTEVSYVPAYGTPNRYEIGHVELRGRRPFRDFNEEIRDGTQAPCHHCPILPVCGGACPKLWSEGRVPCPSMKANLGERLLLWGALHDEGGAG